MYRSRDPVIGTYKSAITSLEVRQSHGQCSISLFSEAYLFMPSIGHSPLASLRALTRRTRDSMRRASLRVREALHLTERGLYNTPDVIIIEERPAGSIASSSLGLWDAITDLIDNL